MQAILAMRADLPPRLFAPDLRQQLADLVEFRHCAVVTQFDSVDPRDLRECEVLITGWGAPGVGDFELARLPALRAIVHTGGSVRGLLTPNVWRRGIVVSTAAEANAIPVGEYTLAMIILALKRVPWLERQYAATHQAIDLVTIDGPAGTAGRTIGIVGASRTGREVMRRLRAFDLDVLVYDPYLTTHDAHTLGATKTDLETLAARSDVLSVHAPWNHETEGMISAEVLARMGVGATLINTARGGVVDQDALVRNLETGRIFAILDVSSPEVLSPDHPLRHLENVYLTPHVAGAVGSELSRLGASAVAEVARFVHGQPLRHGLELDALRFTA